MSTVFGVELDKNRIADAFVEGTRRNEVFNDYFSGRLKVLDKGQKQWVLIAVKSPFPLPFAQMALASLLVVLACVVIFDLSTWALLLPLIVCLPLIVESPAFWTYMTKRKLKKHGYDGACRILKNSELLLLVMDS